MLYKNNVLYKHLMPNFKLILVNFHVLNKVNAHIRKFKQNVLEMSTTDPTDHTEVPRFHGCRAYSIIHQCNFTEIHTLIQ